MAWRDQAHHLTPIAAAEGRPFITYFYRVSAGTEQWHFPPVGEKRWAITDVVGLEDGLGVECLSGSGAIASAFSKAFRDGLTITMVSGR